MLPGMKHMHNPPEGDPRQLRDDFASKLETLDLAISQALVVIAMVTVLSNAWVGVKIKDVKLTINTEQDTPPSRAQMLQQGDRLSRRRPDKTQSSTTTDAKAVVAAFQQAAREGWCEVVDGYAYPTQKLASFLTAR